MERVNTLWKAVSKTFFNHKFFTDMVGGVGGSGGWVLIREVIRTGGGSGGHQALSTKSLRSRLA